MTFYGLTHPLNKSWHVLGLGYNPSIDRTEIENAAVIHYNGNMKPWLEIAMTKYRPYWTKYIKYNHPYLRSCKLSEWRRSTWNAPSFFPPEKWRALVTGSYPSDNYWGNDIIGFSLVFQHNHWLFFITIQLISLVPQLRPHVWPCEPPADIRSDFYVTCGRNRA